MKAPASRPSSDVSAGVGLTGLVGLAVWVLLCRNWGVIADALALPGPHAPLSGPNAALAAMLFSGAPMVAWSIFVDKVHLRASTGIDWHNPRPLREIMDITITKVAGLWATWSILGFLYCLCRWYWRGQYLFAMDVMTGLAPLLFLGTIPYVLWLDRVLVNPRDASWHFGAMLVGRETFDRSEVAHHMRAWAVKGFFCAFMFSILPGGFSNIVLMDYTAVLGDPIVLGNAMVETMFLVDVQIAMVGYLLTMKPLDAQIRSANTYLAGWVAALICYPPFILMGGGGVLDYRTNGSEWTFWMQGMPVLQWIWAAALVLLTGIYAWATVAFGLRFSNLTYRGVLTNGPYAFTRHPAYLSKNTFWWLSTLPFLTTTHSTVDAVRNTIILAVVSAVYFWRAKTEEAHLLAEDAKYREYHAWMAEHGLVTSALNRLGRALTRGRPRVAPPAIGAVHPAE